MDNFEYRVSMIVPIYNMEKFLRECLDSLVAQTISPDDMEVLMVDDGSPDNSIEIMEEYAAKYPNFKVLRKENGGLSDARNYGIKHAKGRFLMYLDADDTLTPETVEEVSKYHEKHADEVDLVTYMEYPIIAGEKGKPHYRFNTLLYQGIYDLNNIDNAYISQTRVNICVKNLGDDNVMFDTDRTFRHEDQKYCTQVLQRKMKIGFCDKGEYLYLHQPESIVRTYFYAYYIFESTMKFWEEIFACYENEVPKYIQALYVNDISWKTVDDKLLPYHYSPEKFEEAKSRVIAILNRIEDDVIINHPAVDNFHKQFFIGLKSNNDINILSGPREIVVTNHGRIIYENKSIEIIFRKLELKNGKIKVLAFLKSAMFNYVDKPKLYIIRNRDLRNKEEIEIVPSSWSYYRSKTWTNNFWLFNYEIDVKEQKTFEFKVLVGDDMFDTHFFFMQGSYFSPKAKRTDWFKDGYKFSVIGKAFYTQKAKKAELAEHKAEQKRKYRKTDKKSWLRRQRLIHLQEKGERIWLYHDCKGVGKDNGYFQFDHDFYMKDGVKRYYVINEDNFEFLKSNYPREQRKYLVKFGSEKHKMLYLSAEKVLTAFIERNNWYPFAVDKGFGKFVDIATQPEMIYLQHGVLHAHLPWKYSLDRLGIDKEVISTHYETDNFINNYCFKEENLIKSGMPRYDYMDPEKPAVNRILFAPSWRKYLVGLENGEWLTTEGKFKISQFYHETLKFLNSPELEALLEKYDYYLDFKLHPILKRYEHMYDITNSRVTLAEAKISETDYKVFMTDFSSFVFDFVYLNRSIIYFVPDEDMFRGGMNDYRELDIPLDDGFGDKVNTTEEALVAIEKILKNNGNPEKKYADKMKDFFFYKDNNQRDRVYEAVISD